MVIYPRCQTQNPDGAIQCGRCGYPLQYSQMTPYFSTMAPPMNPYGNAQMDPEKIRVEQIQNGRVNKPSKKKTDVGKIILLVICLLLLISNASFFWFYMQSRTENLQIKETIAELQKTVIFQTAVGQLDSSDVPEEVLVEQEIKEQISDESQDIEVAFGYFDDNGYKDFCRSLNQASYNGSAPDILKKTYVQDPVSIGKDGDNIAFISINGKTANVALQHKNGTQEALLSLYNSDFGSITADEKDLDFVIIEQMLCYSLPFLSDEEINSYMDQIREAVGKRDEYEQQQNSVTFGISSYYAPKTNEYIGWRFWIKTPK